ncbi:hypothetical protein SAY87_019563 [Trapa incisa]|uniref:Uncharacterized protein n=1 Tax=Trapa incisa TaxID=236973 RepID=A0AAN7K2K8_9MYRT|nr:hypothetical protein SAY87_019563 [Trapa incisa]
MANPSMVLTDGSMKKHCFFPSIPFRNVQGRNNKSFLNSGLLFAYVCLLQIHPVTLRCHFIPNPNFIPWRSISSFTLRSLECNHRLSSIREFLQLTGFLHLPPAPSLNSLFPDHTFDGWSKEFGDGE